jgi:hypothetical protein
MSEIRLSPETQLRLQQQAQQQGLEPEAFVQVLLSYSQLWEAELPLALASDFVTAQAQSLACYASLLQAQIDL